MRQLTPCRLRGVQIYRCASRRRLLASAAQLRSYSSEPPSPPTGPSPPQQKAPPTGPSPPQQKAPPTGPSPPQQKGPAGLVKERALVALQHAGELGRQWGQRSARAAAATADYWWGRYEAFVGLNEVRQAQTKVTEAEAAFMVARGVVREAHGGLEALQGRLKEVRDRLDRVSREEGHYLELATIEHKLLQEERRLRTAYEGAEGAERERFALFSAAVRESHEKERARAERTKNWSVIGSVLGALIGVMGSTYVNRVRLQELKHLLLEAQKGPESLQEALRVQEGNHRSQQDQLRQLIASLRAALDVDPRDPGLTRLQQEVAKVEGQLQAVRKLLETRPRPAETAERRGPEAAAGRLEDGQRALGERIRMSSVYSAAFSYTAAAIGAAAVYLLLRGAG